MTYVSPPQNLRLHVLQFLLPALAVGYRSSALIMRITRSALLEVLREDYIRTARAKGQSAGVVVWSHALKNAMLPVVTVIGIEFAFMIGGLVVTETVFNLPGVARFLVQAIQWRDYPMVQNLVMFIAVVVILSNLAVDLLYGVLDPRVRYGRLRPVVVSPRGPLAAPRASLGLGPMLVRFIRKKPLGAAGGVIMAIIVVTALFADPVATHDPIATDAAHTLARPGADALAGHRPPGP